MTKWADYLISAVRYEECGTTRHISQVRVHLDDGGDSLTPGKTWMRKEVVSAIDKGSSFRTIFKGSDGKWKPGEEVEIVERTVRFIKTNPDQTTKDNLDRLPTF